MRISVVISVYNEAESIDSVVRACATVLTAEGIAHEIVVADDGSTDGTAGILAELRRDLPQLRVVASRRNRGQTAGLAAAIRHSTGDIIVGMDGDGQNDPADIPLLLEKLEEGYDVVSGWRRHRQDRWLSRTLPSRVANTIISAVTGVPLHDNGCSLKLYRADVLRALPLYNDMHRFLPGLCAARGARITEVPVRHHARRFGTSKYGLSRVWKVLIDILTLKMLTTFSHRPAVWFGLASLPWLAFAVLCFVAGALSAWTGVGSVVFPTAGILSAYLGIHLLLCGLVAEAIVRHSPFRHPETTLPVLGDVA